ncbi:MAG: ABC transporter permease [Methanobacteriota archaeon]|nr:MAG: ABC transporter permease [Euryarchaeota archaeon]
MPKRPSLLAYAISRLLLAFPMLLILLTVVFAVLRILPGDPIAALYGGRAPADVVAAARERLGLNKPVWEQYVIYLRQIFTGDFGTSLGEIYRGNSVWATVMLKLPATVELAAGGMIVASVVGIGMGVLGGVNRDRPIDVAVRLYGTIVWVIPIFWLGLMLQLIFAVALGWLPPSLRYSSNVDRPPTVTGLLTLDGLLEGNLGHVWVALQHLILPSLTLGLVLSGFFTKTVRANLLRTVSSDFVEAARARGLRWRTVVYRYAFKNALIPVVTILGLQFAILFAGAVLTERTFSWDGMGTLLLDSIESKDYTMIQGTVVIYAFIIIVISVIVDIINGLIDPRVRY